MNLNNIIATREKKNVYRDGNYAIKVFDTSFKKSDVLNEALNQARVEETGLPIPKLKEVELLDDGRWAIVMDYIEGKTLSQLMQEHPENMTEYLNRFVDIQLSIHAKTAPMLSKLTDKMQRKIASSALSATNRYELHTRLAGMPKHKKVLHGDFNPSNIILGTDGIDYIIDWSHATQGNASADAARTYLLYALAKEKDIADEYLDIFCNKADIAKQYVQKWLPIVAASQSVKGKAEEKEFLLHWADVVDYE